MKLNVDAPKVAFAQVEMNASGGFLRQHETRQRWTRNILLPSCPIFVWDSVSLKLNYEPAV